MSRSRSKAKARQDHDEWVIQPGTEVFDITGKKIGGVTDIQGSDLIVHKGGLFPKDVRIPVSAVATHTDDRIDLSVSADEASGFDGSRSVDEMTALSAADEQRGVGESDRTTRRTATGRSATDVETTEVMRVPVIEEQLDPSRHQVERGQVRLETHVTEHEETIDVPVTEERVHIQRVAVDRLATAADLAVDSRTLNVAVYGEEVDLGTRARVIEEIVISKDAVQEIREVSGTVRREDVEVVDNTLTRDQMATTSTGRSDVTTDPSTGVGKTISS